MCIVTQKTHQDSCLLNLPWKTSLSFRIFLIVRPHIEQFGSLNYRLIIGPSAGGLELCLPPLAELPAPNLGLIGSLALTLGSASPTGPLTRTPITAESLPTNIHAVRTPYTAEWVWEGPPKETHFLPDFWRKKSSSLIISVITINLVVINRWDKYLSIHVYQYWAITKH